MFEIEEQNKTPGWFVKQYQVHTVQRLWSEKVKVVNNHPHLTKCA
jgi:hypothetical protein